MRECIFGVSSKADFDEWVQFVEELRDQFEAHDSLQFGLGLGFLAFFGFDANEDIILVFGEEYQRTHRTGNSSDAEVFWVFFVVGFVFARGEEFGAVEVDALGVREVDFAEEG